MPIAREKAPNADPSSPQTIDAPANNRLPLNRQQLALLSLTASSFLRPTLEPTQIVPSIFFARRGYYLRHPERRRLKVGRSALSSFSMECPPLERVFGFSSKPSAGVRWRGGTRGASQTPPRAAVPGPAGARSDLRRRKEKRLAEWATISSNLVFLAFTSFAAL